MLSDRRHLRDRRRVAAPPGGEIRANRALDRGRIEAADDVNAGARGAVVPVVERLDLIERVALEHRLRREVAAVRRIREQRAVELLGRERLWLPMLDGEPANRILLDAREIGVGEQRVLDHVGEQCDEGGSRLAEDVAAEGDEIHAGIDVEIVAHRRRLAGDLRGRPRRRPLLQHVAR